MSVQYPIIQTESGDVQGYMDKTVSGQQFFSFKGIPYAVPPVGELRFKAPVPISAWSGIKDASVEGNRSPQMNTTANFAILGDEDCLYLNIYIPKLPADTKKLGPVMVYIHGGGFRMGSGNEDEFSADFFVQNDTILVTMNYRLGIFGFLSLNIPEVPGNAGLKDQHLALKWVKDNIKHFGGDPKNITLFGISAGGASVEYHLLNPNSKGLFTKAIGQSGSVLCPWALNRDPNDFVMKVTQELGIPEEDPNLILKRLMTFSVKDLLNAAFVATDLTTKKRGDLFGFGPVIEKKFEGVEGFLTEEPYELFKAGNFLKIPTLSSLCRDEGSMFTFFYDKHVEMMTRNHYAEYMSHLRLMDGKDVNARLAKLYSKTNDSEKRRVHNFLSDFMFNSPIYKSMKLRSEFNQRNYCYIFSFVGNLRPDLSVLGFDTSEETQHGADLLYMTRIKDMNFLEDKMVGSDHKVRIWMPQIFTNFAKSGDPSPTDWPTRQQWKPISGEVLEILDIDTALNIIPFPWVERMSVWETFYKD